MPVIEVIKILMIWDTKALKLAIKLINVVKNGENTL